jgi:hypothetical protein
MKKVRILLFFSVCVCFSCLFIFFFI